MERISVELPEKWITVPFLMYMSREILQGKMYRRKQSVVLQEQSFKIK